MRSRIAAGILSVLGLSGFASQSEAQEVGAEATVITNARIFDGRSPDLIEGMTVVIEGNKISRIGDSVEIPDRASLIDAGGRVMSPGFIDTHAHTMYQMSFGQAANADEEYFAYVATQTAEAYLMMGFTTVRDVGGDSFSLKKAIDRGIVLGPRIFPSGPMISQTSGHSDHRTDSYGARPLFNEPSVYMKYGHVAVADGVPEVLTVVREALRRGATQIKICTGGGTGSYADPLDVQQFTDEEIQAAVEAATHWNTYVTAHVYNSDGLIRAIENGVRCIEHGNLMNEEAMQLMKEKDIWLSPQVIVYTFHPDGFTDDQKAKHDQAYEGIDNMFTIAKKIGFDKISFGSDIITSPEMVKRIPEEFELRTEWFTPAEVLAQATSKSGELCMMCGPRNLYGTIGVIEEGALADLLLINGNPLEDISILQSPEERLALIMKDGKVYKNTLEP